jgi:hypothetical protein
VRTTVAFTQWKAISADERWAAWVARAVEHDRTIKEARNRDCRCSRVRCRALAGDSFCFDGAFAFICVSPRAQGETATMTESRFNDLIARPTRCPFCQGKVVDTLAKTITMATLWRCRECEGAWTLASRAASPAR